MRLLILSCFLSFVWQATAAAQAFDNAALFPRSLVSTGDLSRVWQVLAKAERGEKVTVAVIGGSITQGAKASKPELRYGNLVAAWLRQAFPKAQVEFVNAGIGATGSNFGALRARRDLLSHSPDFVVVEYGVNDGNTQAAAETLEGLVRQILKQPNRPAVVQLFMMHQGGGNAQEWHGKVGAHYSLPIVSYRDALGLDLRPSASPGTRSWPTRSTPTTAATPAPPSM
jgi:lysophospholipase L1-like esterase